LSELKLRPPNAAGDLGYKTSGAKATEKAETPLSELKLRPPKQAICGSATTARQTVRKRSRLVGVKEGVDFAGDASGALKARVYHG